MSGKKLIVNTSGGFANKVTRKVKTPLGSIAYELERKRIKRLNLRVRSDLSVYLSIPWNTSYEFADKFVSENASFIFDAIAKISQKNKFDLNHTFYLGKKTEIKTKASDDFGGSLGESGILTLFVPSKESENNEEIIKKSLELWQREKAGELLPKALKTAHDRFCAVGFNIPYPKLAIRMMKSRWGSCAAYKGKITLNVKLVEKPFICIEQVACHELAHFIFQDHSQNFYKILDIVMPEHREVNRLLKM